MDDQLKRRLVGAAVLVSLAVIFIPIVLDTSGTHEPRIVASNIPAKPETGFSSSIIPLESPQTPSLDELAVREARRQQQDALLREQQASVTPIGEAATGLENQTLQTVAPTDASPKVEAGNSAPIAWVVQLGSFSNRENALALRDKLRKQGYSAYIESAYSKKNTVTRVIVGPERDREQANKTLTQLNKDTGLRGIVIQFPG